MRIQTALLSLYITKGVLYYFTGARRTQTMNRLLLLDVNRFDRPFHKSEVTDADQASVCFDALAAAKQRFA